MTTHHGKAAAKCWRIGLLLPALLAGIDAFAGADSAVNPAAPLAQPPAGRVRPPAEVACPRDRLTLYAGQVAGYTRGPGRTTLRIRTDWQTTEAVVIRHPGTSDPSRWFLIEGQPFADADWARIEARAGHLRGGVRAAAWACDDGRNPLVDWSPPRPP